MKIRRKRYRIREDRFIPFVFLLILLIIILSVIAKCTQGRKPSSDQPNVVGGIWTSGLVLKENSEAAGEAVQLLESRKENRKIASRLAEDTYLVQSNGMKQIPRPVLPGKRNPSGDCFENSVFLGNSCLEGLRNFGLIEGAAYLTKVGLNVNSAYEKRLSGSSVSIMEELSISFFVSSIARS